MTLLKMLHRITKTESYLRDNLIFQLTLLVKVLVKQLKCNTRKSYSIFKVIEHLEGIRNAMYIGPFSFAEGLFKLNFSGPKASHSLDSCSRACGGVTTMKNFLRKKEQSQTHVTWQGTQRSLQIIQKGRVEHLE